MSYTHLHTPTRISPRWIAITTGGAIVLMALAAGWVMSIFQPLWDLGAPIEQWQALTQQPQQLKSGILGWTLILILDLVAAWGLFACFSEKGPQVARLGGWLRLGYSAILAIAIGQLVQLDQLITLVQTFDGVGEHVWALQASQYLMGFEQIWTWGLIVFGLHLIVMGYLAYRPDWRFRLLSGLLMLGGLGYVVLDTMPLIWSGFAAVESTVEMIFMLPMIAGELGLAIWLLGWGGKSA
ncbi:DUF4386 domain-containing protein [Pontibacter sp. G13]|uniref:DUF4386 domain-containing protein n=1 Tax=Pontibacter sp. G13 TaxID=3074898 RepID=UPI002889D7FB|nr:DUF4386 domain-containing protein [Pontibacter sp. G13]WNJ20311.1 DUF4386 domain-containing protein [Pontibacter sp. G13]